MQTAMATPLSLTQSGERRPSRQSFLSRNQMAGWRPKETGARHELRAVGSTHALCGDPEDMGYELRAACARLTRCRMRGCGHGGARAEKGARRDGEEEEGHAPLVAGEDRRVELVAVPQQVHRNVERRGEGGDDGEQLAERGRRQDEAGEDDLGLELGLGLG